jgi:hypothetical protein
MTPEQKSVAANAEIEKLMAVKAKCDALSYALAPDSPQVLINLLREAEAELAQTRHNFNRRLCEIEQKIWRRI